MPAFKVGDIVKPCDSEAFEREFGLAQMKSEGDLICVDDMTSNGGGISDSRWIEMRHSEKEYKEMGINIDASISHITSLINDLTAHLTEDQRYIAITKIVNDLIPESGY